MKMSGTAKIKSIEWLVFKAALLIAMATLNIGFLKVCKTIYSGCCLVLAYIGFNCSRALKRVVDTIVHLRKFALFPCSGEHGLIT